MNLENYLLEVNLQDESLEGYFNEGLKQVFSPVFLSKINKKIQHLIPIKYVENHNNSNEVVWTENNEISVNKKEFEKIDVVKRIKYLLHEFIHILLNSKSFFVINAFIELRKVSNKMHQIVEQYAIGNVGAFLINKTIEEKYLNNQESLAYFMNGKMNWKMIKPEGAKLLKETIINSGLFNTSSEFWRKRI